MSSQQILLLIIFVGIPLIRWIAGEAKRQNERRGYQKRVKAQRMESERTGRPATEESSGTKLMSERSTPQQPPANSIQAMMLQRQEQLRKLREEQLRKLRAQQADQRSRVAAQRASAASASGASQQSSRANRASASRQTTQNAPTPVSRSRPQQQQPSRPQPAPQTQSRTASRRPERPALRLSAPSATPAQIAARQKQIQRAKSAILVEPSAPSRPRVTREDISASGLRKAIILSEILAPPVSMRAP